MFTAILVFGPASAAFLRDADTGWHIRNGEHILQTHSVPRVDYFSASMAGRPWYAWEWLYDAAAGAIHARMGLNGVVVISGLLFAFTFALLFRFMLARAGDFSISLLLTLISAFATQSHILARPHILSWLFTVVWLHLLYRAKWRELLCLPLLMLLWVNVHGGFTLGLALLIIFIAAELWRYFGAAEPDDRRAAKTRVLRLAAVTAVCLAVTFSNPYGYRLHAHIAGYLSNSWLINKIDEFASPNFHAPYVQWFELLLLLAFAGLACSRKKPLIDILVALLAIHLALYAGRAIPTSAIMLSFAIGPWFAVRDSAATNASKLSNFLLALDDFSTGMKRLEYGFRGHAIAIIIAIAAVGIAWHGGRIGSYPLLNAHFSEARFPVQAADFIERQPIRGPLFATDAWSGYLIYRLYPHNKMFIDDRHDFYSQKYLMEYLRVANVEPGWDQVLTGWRVNWILIPANSALSSTLKLSPSWYVAHDDGVAILFGQINK